MATEELTGLRVLIADERNKYLEALARAIDQTGHRVIATELDTTGVGRATVEHRPEIAIVALHDDTEHALDLITHITDESNCPVVALVEDARPEFVTEAAARGIFAYLDSAEEEELRGGIEVAIQRFREYKGLQRAFARRARIERAKGILMERHGLEEQEAFERLRGEARNSRRQLIDVVDEVIASPARAG